MSKATHTPGPWMVVDETEILVMADTPECRVIADIQLLSGPVSEEQRANARLIAAAPLMFAALNACFEFALEMGEDLGYEPWPQVIAALAKARGGE